MSFYLVLGMVLIAIATVALWMGITPAFVAFAGGTIELLCSAFILVPAKR
jgi:hypothetical protein